MFRKYRIFLLFFLLVPCISAQHGVTGLGGMQGIINNMITTGTDVVESGLDLAEKSTFSLKQLLRNAVFTLVNNPITRITVGFRNRAVGSSLVMLRNAYVERIDPVIDTVQAQLDQIDELREQAQRTRKLLKKPIADIKRKIRCMTSTMAAKISKELQICGTIPLKNIVTEIRNTQMEVRKAYEMLQIKLRERDACLHGLPKDTVVCTQNLVNEMAAFVDSLISNFAPSPSIFELMVPIEHCIRMLQRQTLVLCPANQ